MGRLLGCDAVGLTLCPRRCLNTLADGQAPRIRVVLSGLQRHSRLNTLADGQAPRINDWVCVAGFVTVCLNTLADGQAPRIRKKGLVQDLSKKSQYPR